MPKCRYCKAKFTASFNSTERFCGIPHAMAWLATPEGAEASKKAKAKKVEREAKAARKAKVDLNRRTLSWQLAKTQQAFNKMRRLQEIKWFKDQGLEPECISCGKTHMDWCAGHLITAGSSGNLRFDESNVFLQCNFRCNQNLSGNRKGNSSTRGYEQGLIDRFGEQRGREIIQYCEENQHKVKRFTCDELERMRARFNSAIRSLEQSSS